MYKKLTDYEKRKILTEFLEQNGIDFTDKEYKRILRLYDDIMVDPINANKTKAGQESALTAIAIDVKVRNITSDEKIFIENTSYKHISYFDIFLAEGEADNILKILKEYNIPPDVLRGVRLNLPMEGDNISFERENKNGKKVKDNVKLTQTIIKDQNSSPYIGEFVIEYKGKIIYKFAQDFKGQASYLNFIERSEQDKDKVQRGKTIEVRKVKTTKYEYYERSYEKKDGTIATKKQYVKNTIINGEKVGGRFFK